jgi:hypothetical protein
LNFRILIKTLIFGQILEKYANITFHEHQLSGSRVIPCRQTNGRTDKYDEANSCCSQFLERSYSHPPLTEPVTRNFYWLLPVRLPCLLTCPSLHYKQRLWGLRARKRQPSQNIRHGAISTLPLCHKLRKLYTKA